ncbi:MAG: hypothetical protein ACK574_05830, partial [Bacteroidota bacterium]
SYTTSATSRNNNFSAKGGKGGIAGLGGWGDFNITDSRMFKKNECTNDDCGGGGSSCYTYYCDIEKVIGRMRNSDDVIKSTGVL